MYILQGILLKPWRILFHNANVKSGINWMTFNRISFDRHWYYKQYTQWARAHGRRTCRPRDASEPRITVVLIELLFQLMSTFIIRVHIRCRSGMKKTRIPPKELRLAHKSAEHSSSVVYVMNRDAMAALSFLFPLLCKDKNEITRSSFCQNKLLAIRIANHSSNNYFNIYR